MVAHVDFLCLQHFGEFSSILRELLRRVSTHMPALLVRSLGQSAHSPRLLRRSPVWTWARSLHTVSFPNTCSCQGGRSENVRETSRYSHSLRRTRRGDTQPQGVGPPLLWVWHHLQGAGVGADVTCWPVTLARHVPHRLARVTFHMPLNGVTSILLWMKEAGAQKA